MSRFSTLMSDHLSLEQVMLAIQFLCAISNQRLVNNYGHCNQTEFYALYLRNNTPSIKMDSAKRKTLPELRKIRVDNNEEYNKIKSQKEGCDFRK